MDAAHCRLCHVPWRLLVVACLCCLSPACSRLQERTLKIAIHRGVEGVALKAVAAAFSAEENVSVEVNELPYDDLFSAELGDVQKNQPQYDVLMLDDPWLPALFGESGEKRLAPLDFRAECNTLRLDDFFEPTLRVSLDPSDMNDPTCASTFYSLPFVGNTQLFAVRRDAGQKPETWADVAGSASTQSGANGGGQGYVMRAGPGNSIVTDFMPILWEMDPLSRNWTLERKTDAGSPEPLLRPESAPALTFVRELGRGASRAVVSFDDFDLAVYLAKGHASMATVWSAWVMAVATLPSSSSLLKDVKIGPLPGMQPALGAWLLAIPSKTPARQRALARQFLLFATDVDRMEAAAVDGNPPPRRSVLEGMRAWKGRSQPYWNEFIDAQTTSLETARPRPRTPRWREVERAFGECLSALYESAIDEQQAMDRTNRAIAALRAAPAGQSVVIDDCWAVESRQRPSF